MLVSKIYWRMACACLLSSSLCPHWARNIQVVKRYNWNWKYLLNMKLLI